VKKLYSLFDRQTEFFGAPICCINDGDALRSFAQTVTDPQSQVHQYMDDYTLYLLGEFDPETGRIDRCDPPQIVASARTVYHNELRRQAALEDDNDG